MRRAGIARRRAERGGASEVIEHRATGLQVAVGRKAVEVSMMTATATKSAALAAAKRKWGKRAYVEERRNAPTADERAANHARVREIIEQEKANEQAIKLLGAWPGKLAEAARFVVDVNGDEPSIPQLREAIEKVEELNVRIGDRRAMREEREHLPTHSKRWKAGIVNDVAGIGFSHVRADADTLEELIEKIG